MTQQNSPSGAEPPSEPAPPQPAPATQPPAAAAAAPAAPSQPGPVEPPAPPISLAAADAPAPAMVPAQAAGQVPQQAFGTAPASETTPTSPTAGESFGAAPVPPAPAGETFGAAPTVPATGSGPETFGPAPGSDPAAPPAPEKKRSGRVLGIIGAIILAILIAGAAYLVRDRMNGNSLEDAAVGDCVGNVSTVAPGQDVEANDAQLVDCASADALYKVEGRLENKTDDEAKAEDVCDSVPNADANFRAINPGGRGFVLCLSTIK